MRWTALLLLLVSWSVWADTATQYSVAPSSGFGFSSMARFQSPDAACGYAFDMLSQTGALGADSAGQAYVAYSLVAAGSGYDCRAVTNGGNSVSMGAVTQISTTYVVGAGATEGTLQGLSSEMESVRSAVNACLVALLGVVFVLGVVTGQQR